MSDIKESDWKILRGLKAQALERFCEITLAEAKSICDDNSQAFHERYLKLFTFIERRDEALAIGFNDLRRSNAHPRLVFMRASELITDDECSKFSGDLRNRIDAHIKDAGLEE